MYQTMLRIAGGMLHRARDTTQLSGVPRRVRDPDPREVANAIVVHRDRWHLADMHTLFAMAGSVINFVACVSYIRAILKGEATPNRVTWILWALVPLIAGVAQWRSGVGISTLVVLSVGLGPACIVLASFVAGTGSWKLGPFDYACGACSLAALALWSMTGDPVVAIVLSILADAAAALPTLRKAWLAPATEDRSAYLIAFAGMVLGILSVEEATFSAYAFNAYLVMVSGALVLILYLPRKHALTGTLSTE